MSFKDKIPFIKDMDLSDPKRRKELGIMALAFIAIIVYAVYTIGTFKDSESEDEERTENSYQGKKHSEDSVVPKFASGEDREAKYTSHIEALADSRRAGIGARDIWNNSSSHLDDLRSKFRDSVQVSTGNASPAESEQSKTFGRTNVYPERPKQEPRTVETDEQQRAKAIEKRRREILLSQGIDPDTNLPLAYSNYGKTGGGTSTTSAQTTEVTTEPEAKPEEAVVAQPKVVRRTSSIYSLDESNSNSMGEISSLDDQDEYISEADTHPIKVMFSSTAKIQSGQRVYLRLLEDIMVDGMLVPKNTQLPAICQIGERISIKVNSLEMNNKIYALNYDGYDTDGGLGLYCPQSNTNKNIKEGVQQGASIASSVLASVIKGYAGTVTNAGVNIAQRNLANETVTVSSGYTFFLVKSQR